jgi:hypothetical protein
LLEVLSLLGATFAVPCLDESLEASVDIVVTRKCSDAGWIFRSENWGDPWSDKEKT